MLHVSEDSDGDPDLSDDYLTTSTFTIPGTLPSLNKIIDASKASKEHYWHNVKTPAVEKVGWAAKGLPKYEYVDIKTTYYCPTRRTDPDNIAAAKKFILDGLKDVGVIPNDGWKQVKGFRDSWEKDKENPRIKVRIIGKEAESG